MEKNQQKPAFYFDVEIKRRDLLSRLTIAALLAEKGYDPVYGARPLKREIQNQLETPLAREILSGDFAAGETITIDAKNGSLVFSSNYPIRP